MLIDLQQTCAMTTSLVSLFQCLTTLLVKNFFLISYLNFPWNIFTLFPCILSLDTREKRSAPPSLLPLMKKV